MANQRSSAHMKAQKAGQLRDGNTCQICGSRDHVEGHHIVDYAFGSAPTKDNIIALCHKHHRDVHDGNLNILSF